MSKYKITLTPNDWFFFGGEQTFDNGSSQSFIAHSNRYPQQTALLGMVRYQLLKQAQLLTIPGKSQSIEETDKAKSLIGNSSFSLDNTEEQKYGVINNISPVFIQFNDQQLLPMPFTHGATISFSALDDGLKMCMNGAVKECVPYISSLDSKNYSNPDKLVDANGKEYLLKDIFLSSMKIGITKAQDGDNNEDGFFTQETLRFSHNQTSFVFFLDLKDGYTIKSDVVFIGAQRSCFQMDVSICDSPLFVPTHPEHTILICSPTYIDDIDALNNCCFFQWTRSMPFRNIIQAENGRLKSGVVSYRRYSAVSTFLTPGSVLFFKPEERGALEKMLANKNLDTIGYNKYHINE